MTLTRRIAQTLTKGQAQANLQSPQVADLVHQAETLEQFIGLLGRIGIQFNQLSSADQRRLSSLFATSKTHDQPYGAPPKQKPSAWPTLKPRERVAQVEGEADQTGDLDLLQEYVESLADSLQDIQYVNQDLQKALESIKQQAAVQETYPLPDADTDVDGMQKAAGFKFSRATPGGLQRVRRLSAERKARLSFTADELKESRQ